MTALRANRAETVTQLSVRAERFFVNLVAATGTPEPDAVGSAWISRWSASWCAVARNPDRSTGCCASCPPPSRCRFRPARPAEGLHNRAAAAATVRCRDGPATARNDGAGDRGGTRARPGHRDGLRRPGGQRRVGFHSSGEGAHAAADAAGGAGVSALAVDLDIRSDERVRAALETVTDVLGPIGVWSTTQPRPVAVRSSKPTPRNGKTGLGDGHGHVAHQPRRCQPHG